MDDYDDIDLGQVATKEVLGLLECPVCLDHITPPVKQCIKGHLVCIDCFPRLHHCPTCRSAMCDERNLAMEQVSRLLKYPCRWTLYIRLCRKWKGFDIYLIYCQPDITEFDWFPFRYNPMGCKEAFPLSKKAEHERDCEFLQLKCPFHGQCAFNGWVLHWYLSLVHFFVSSKMCTNGREYTNKRE